MSATMVKVTMITGPGLERALEGAEVASVLVCGSRAAVLARRILMGFDFRAKGWWRGAEPALRLVEVAGWDQDRWELF